MSKEPYTFGRLVTYAVAAIVMGFGSSGGFSACNDDNQDTPKICRTNSHGERDCPMQTGRQEP